MKFRKIHRIIYFNKTSSKATTAIFKYIFVHIHELNISEILRCEFCAIIQQVQSSFAVAEWPRTKKVIDNFICYK